MRPYLVISPKANSILTLLLSGLKTDFYIKTRLYCVSVEEAHIHFFPITREFY